MKLEQRRQAMLQLHLSDQQFYCLLNAPYISELMVALILLSGEPDYFGRNKILSGYDLSYYQVPHCIRVFFYFAWFVFIHHNFSILF